VREHMIVEQDPATGSRLKRYSRAADVDYWTELWQRSMNVSYERERRGHLPHQLRATFRRWVRPNARTLEAGCGLGHFTVAIDAMGHRAEGLDWSEATIDRLRRQFSWIPWHVGDVRRLQFDDHTFDAIYSPGVCEHFVEGPADVLEETRRVLKPGGIAVISTPCFNEWLQRRTAQLLARPAAIDESAFYEYAFTVDGMARVLEQLGFEVLQIRPYAALDTLMRYGGWRLPRTFVKPVAFSMDCLPIVRNWGSTCIWVARRR
jgi:SAM-dependent methyltransferase